MCVFVYSVSFLLWIGAFWWVCSMPCVKTTTKKYCRLIIKLNILRCIVVCFMLFWFVPLVRATLQKGYCNGKLNLGVHARIGIAFLPVQSLCERVQHLWKSGWNEPYSHLSSHLFYIHHVDIKLFSPVKTKKTIEIDFPFVFHPITLQCMRSFMFTLVPKSHA